MPPPNDEPFGGHALAHGLAADDSAGTSLFPPIADYAFLSDCETTALVAPSGAVEWMCIPRMDSPSVFGALLDRDAGWFRVGPAEAAVPVARRYLPGTMVLETTWSARGGWLVVRDALLIGPWHHTDQLSGSHRRAPTDYDADHVLVRELLCTNGEVQVALECAPMFDYGRRAVAWTYPGGSYHEAVTRGRESDPELRLRSDMRLGLEGSMAVARTLLRAGERRFCALSWSDHPPPGDADEAGARLQWTENHWRHWLDRGRFPDHRWRAHLQRSALTLKALTFAPTGAVAAAATTSLPETPGGERNWDYRYTWIRDATHTLWALYTLGFDWEASDFFHFVADIAGRDGADMQIMYGLDGRPRLDEEVLEHLSGYEGAQPVRIGNAAYVQRQNDVWGSLLGAAWLHALHARSRGQLRPRAWPVIVALVERALEHWEEPDCGLWEVRGEPKHFTFSKVACWIAAARGAHLALLQGDHQHAARWQAAAAAIHADVCANAVDERGVFTQHYDTTALDASLLLLPMVGFLPAQDERVRRTVLAIADELTQDGLVLRYRTQETDDGLHGEEGTFTTCSFWLVSALVAIGEVARGRDLCERLLSFASELGLYAEEIDTRTGQHLGNFPQALTHLALINAVISVIRAERGLRTSEMLASAETTVPQPEPDPAPSP
ncbi:MAG: glycoside hydrolase family 15 protein [Actinobacteria bacterium]|nr:MAG: glycoside hydrolase family 15 protein [Actinomycetota bacterium]